MGPILIICHGIVVVGSVANGGRGSESLWERNGGGGVCVREEAREGICKARVAQVLCMD